MIRLNVFRVTGPKGLRLMFLCAFTGSALSMLSDEKGGLGALQHYTNTRPVGHSTVLKIISQIN